MMWQRWFTDLDSRTVRAWKGALTFRVVGVVHWLKRGLASRGERQQVGSPADPVHRLWRNLQERPFVATFSAVRGNLRSRLREHLWGGRRHDRWNRGRGSVASQSGSSESRRSPLSWRPTRTVWRRWGGPLPVDTASGSVEATVAPGVGDVETDGKPLLFKDGGPSGFERWEAITPQIHRLGVSGRGILQARLVWSELALRTALDGLEAAVEHGRGPIQAWRQAAEILASGWQRESTHFVNVWHNTFTCLELGWRGAGIEVRDREMLRAWQVATGHYSGVLSQGGASISKGLQETEQAVVALLDSVAEDPELAMAGSNAVWERIVGEFSRAFVDGRGVLDAAWRELCTAYESEVRLSLESGVSGPCDLQVVSARISEVISDALRTVVEKLLDAWMNAVESLTSLWQKGD